MPGGLLNLVSEGQQNIILNGNPSKTFFKRAYSKYTNFGLQKFRVEFEGSTTLRLNEESSFIFKIPRYADLLMDCYLSIDLPNIWSPIISPNVMTSNTINTPYVSDSWSPYEFKWIENIGVQMIKQITITCGNQKLQEFSGAYLLSLIQRDFTSEKKDLFNEMIGNIPELVDPPNYGNNNGFYPNAYYTDNQSGSDPSIRGRTLYVPINAWFGLKSQMAFPLVSLQYNILTITVTMRPISELFQIRNVFDVVNNFPYIAPNFNSSYMHFYRFLKSPPDIDLDESKYTDKRTIWNTNIHLNCTYCFLSTKESRLFASYEQTYLFKQVNESIFYNVTGVNNIEIYSIGLVASWMFYLQRSDVNLRNEWSNYSNWEYNYQPSGLEVQDIFSNDGYNPSINPNSTYTGIKTTPNYTIKNVKSILISLGILLDGQYRENNQPAGVYNYIEKYIRTASNAPDGLYCYNFCLNTNPFKLQPSGAINTNRFKNLEFEVTTIIPPLDPNAQSLQICDPVTSNVIGINKPMWRVYEYNYNFILFEERFNIVTFIGGNAGLMYAT